MKTCERCGKEIPPERIEALPETKLCIGCSEAIGGDVEVCIIEENLEDTDVSDPVIHKIPKKIEPLDS